MLFNSWTFAVFLVTVLGLYWAMRGSFRAQNVLILLASYLFYGWWDVRFLFLIVVATTLDYWSALATGTGQVTRAQRIKASTFLCGSALLFTAFDWKSFAAGGYSLGGLSAAFPESLGDLKFFLASLAAVVLGNIVHPFMIALPENLRRRLYLTLSICGNLAILGFFKYYDFFAQSLHAAFLGAFGIELGDFTLDVILPVGISFYTFQTMSYTIDVYRKQLQPTSSLTHFASYLVFFPQLVAGPIERGTHLIPQFARPRTTTWEDWREGTWLIAWGLFKKIVIADNVARIVNEGFGPFDRGETVGTPEDGLRMLLLVYGFAIQIYADFSAYSDIARGAAKLMGFDIMLNFNLPYFATSPSEFWKRWHISLSSWLRDYLYIPLGGNRKGPIRTYVNLSLTMLLGGLWHGAAWNFVAWGAYQGLLLVGYRAAGIRTEEKQYPRWALFLMGVVMFQFTCIGWLLFRARNLETIRVFAESVFMHPRWSSTAAAVGLELLAYSWPLVLFQIIQKVSGTLNPMKKWHWFIRLNVWLFIIMSMLTQYSRSPQEFIYFDF